MGPKQRFDIGWAEAIIVEIGLRVAIKYALVNRSLGANFLVRSDNMGIVTVTNKGRSRSLETNIVLKRLYLLQARLGIRLRTVYVPSTKNISDPLSRGDVVSFLQAFPSITERIVFELPSHLSSRLISW